MSLAQQALIPLPSRCWAWAQCLSVCLSTSTLSSCSHAVVALLYPFSWQHTFIPVLPASMIDIVCCPTPFLVGLLSSSLPKLKELPVEEVGHLGNQLWRGWDRRNGIPQEGRAEGEGVGEGCWDLLVRVSSSSPCSLGGLSLAGVLPVI